MRMLVMAATGLAALALSAASAGAAEPNGQWLTEGGKARVQIAACGSALCGSVVWLREPTGANGKPKVDEKNKDESKRTRPIIGSQVLLGLKPDGANSWKGQIYNAEDGNTYTAVVAPKGDGQLSVKGCAMAGLICKEQLWTRSK